MVWPRAAWPGAETTERPRREAGKPELPEGALRVVTIPGTPVLPGNTQTIQVGFGEPLEPGEYTADLNGTLGDGIVDRGFHFTVAAPE